jgi:hypothetical protein
MQSPHLFAAVLRSPLGPAAIALTLVFCHGSVADIHVAVMANPQQISNFFGTNNVRLVFAGGLDSADMYLYYVDFSETGSPSPAVHKIAATCGAWNQSLSFDGKWVAYTTGAEGDTSVSTWLCGLSETAQPVLVTKGHANEPRLAKRTDSLQVIYSTTWQVGDWNGVGKTVFKNIIASVPESAQSVLYADGSFHAGLSCDRRYLGTTMFEPNPRMADLRTGTVYALHSLLCTDTIDHKDTVLNIQSCNGSISSSGIFTNVMMYLDFGLPQGYVVPSLSPWGFHQRIFVESSAGQVLRWYDFPDSLWPVARANVSGCVWTYNEWSVNHPYFGVAANITSRYFPSGQGYATTDLCEDVYAIDLKTSSFLKLVESTDNSLTSTTNLQWPSLWVEVPSSFAEDSTWLLPGVQNNAARNRQPFYPAGDVLKLHGETILSIQPIRELRCFDLRGRLILQKSFGDPTVKLSLHGMFAPGVYLLELKTSDTHLVRFVVR